MTPTVRASIGFQGAADFKLSLSSNYTSTYSKNCRSNKYNPNSQSCSEAFNTNNYFDMMNYGNNVSNSGV